MLSIVAGQELVARQTIKAELHSWTRDSARPVRDGPITATFHTADRSPDAQPRHHPSRKGRTPFVRLVADDLLRNELYDKVHTTNRQLKAKFHYSS